jgi:hypothetical protein
MNEENKTNDLLEKILTMQVSILTELRHINRIAEQHNKGGALVTDIRKQTISNLNKSQKEMMASLHQKK